MKPHYHDAPLPKRDPNKHATPWHKAVAEAGTILRTEVGSGLHGTSVSGYDDRDEMGICIEPPSAVIGFERFEQYEWHTAWEREGERANRSGAGDLDVIIYSLRKWMRLAINGNPTVLLLLFAPENNWVTMTDVGHELRNRAAPYILSRVAADRFAGYLNTQRESMLSHDGKGRDITRPELIEQFGFDTKFAAHMIRLGYQGCELLRTGHITLPMPEHERNICRKIRNGAHSMKFCLTLAEALEEEITRMKAWSPLPERPDRDWINGWLSDTYRWYWTLQGIQGYQTGKLNEN